MHGSSGLEPDPIQLTVLQASKQATQCLTSGLNWASLLDNCAALIQPLLLSSHITTAAFTGASGDAESSFLLSDVISSDYLGSESGLSWSLGCLWVQDPFLISRHKPGFSPLRGSLCQAPLDPLSFIKSSKLLNLFLASALGELKALPLFGTAQLRPTGKRVDGGNTIFLLSSREPRGQARSSRVNYQTAVVVLLNFVLIALYCFTVSPLGSFLLLGSEFVLFCGFPRRGSKPTEKEVTITHTGSPILSCLGTVSTYPTAAREPPEAPGNICSLSPGQPRDPPMGLLASVLLFFAILPVQRRIGSNGERRHWTHPTPPHLST